MSDTAQPSKLRPGRPVLVAGALVLVLLSVLVASRGLIAQALATHWLESYGVASKVEVRSLSLTGLKARLRLGAESTPDATVDEVDVAYALDGPWNGHGFGVIPRSLKLVRPHARLRWDGRRLSYGALTRLVQDILARPANPNVPPPDVVIQDGRVEVSTPYGVVGLAGDAAIDRGMLTSLQAQLAPARLTMGASVLTTVGGPISLRRQGDALALKVEAPLQAMGDSGRSVGSGRLMLAGTLPYPKGGAMAGPVKLAGGFTAPRLEFPGVTLDQPTTQLRFDGTARGQTVSGQGHVDLAALGVHAGEVSAKATTSVLDFSSLTLAMTAGEARLDGAGQLTLTAADAAARGYEAHALSLNGRLSRAVWTSKDAAGWALAGAAEAKLRGAGGDGLTFSDLALNVSGQIAPRTISATLGVTGRGSAEAGVARRYAELLAPADPAYAAALQRAARDFSVQAPRVVVTAASGATRLTPAAPIRLTSASGANLTIDGASKPAWAISGDAAWGGFDAALSGGGLPGLRVSVPSWRSGAGVTTASLTASGTLNLGPAQGVVLQNAGGVLRSAGSNVSFSLAGCTPLAARRARFGETAMTDLATRLCPVTDPLVSAGAGRWRTAARFEALGGEAPDLHLRLNGAAGRFDVAGAARGGSAGTISLDTLRLADTTPEPRFNPLAAKGQARIAGDRITGRLTASQPASGRVLATVTLEHDLRRGVGDAVIESHDLAFAKDGLQPGAISPLAAIARDATGTVDFDGRFDWSGKGVTSSGRLRTDALAFSSPLGQVKGARADLRFDSLAPLVTAPGQALTVASIDGVVPMTDLSAGFTLTADAAILDTASAHAAKGVLSLEPMRLDYAGDGTVRGAVLLDHVDLGELLASSSLADSVKMQMVVVGRLPFEIKPPKISFLQGHISAVQPGRISISRAALQGVNTGAPGSSSGAAVNAVQDLAYDALENLAFDTLEADVASRPGGRLGLIFRIKGRYDPPVKQGADLALPDLLNGTAFQKKIPLPSETPINLNLDTSLNFDELMQALADIWKRDESKARSSATVQAPGR